MQPNKKVGIKKSPSGDDDIRLTDWWRTNYKRNPLTQISELKSGTAFAQATEDPAFAKHAKMRMIATMLKKNLK